MIALIDLGMNNTTSIKKAFDRVGCEVKVTQKSSELDNADAIILPGVGSFGDGMEVLAKLELVNPIKMMVKKGIPILGICLGMHLLTERSEENENYLGLGLISGTTGKLDPNFSDERIPNIGWSSVFIEPNSILLNDLENGESFYFAHSYHVLCKDRMVSATIEYGNKKITAAFENKNIFGVQFHPEKSQDAGLRVLSSFLKQIKM